MGGSAAWCGGARDDARGGRHRQTGPTTVGPAVFLGPEDPPGVEGASREMPGAGNTGANRRSQYGTLEPVAADADYELVRACQEPDSDRFDAAFEALYVRYRDRAYSIAYRITGGAADAMDVLQEAWSLLFRKIGTFRFDGPFATWLFRIVVNCSIDLLRQRAGRTSTADGQRTFDSEHEPIDDAAPNPALSAETSELGSHVQRCLGKLSPKLRAILVLRYLEGMSYEELTETLQVSMGTVKSRLARAHVALEQVLRGTLAPFGFPEGLPLRAPEGQAAAGEVA